jgi:hypothetical protein
MQALDIDVFLTAEGVADFFFSPPAEKSYPASQLHPFLLDERLVALFHHQNEILIGSEFGIELPGSVHGNIYAVIGHNRNNPLWGRATDDCRYARRTDMQVRAAIAKAGAKNRFGHGATAEIGGTDEK